MDFKSESGFADQGRAQNHELRYPAGAVFYHCTGHLDAPAIRANGFETGREGESGCGVYLSPTPAICANYPSRTLLTVTLTKPVRLLDRATLEGERLFQDIRAMRGYGQATVDTLQELGFEGVRYARFEEEIVIHDPSILDVS